MLSTDGKQIEKVNNTGRLCRLGRLIVQLVLASSSKSIGLAYIQSDFVNMDTLGLRQFVHNNEGSILAT